MREFQDIVNKMNNPQYATHKSEYDLDKKGRPKTDAEGNFIKPKDRRNNFFKNPYGINPGNAIINWVPNALSGLTGLSFSEGAQGAPGLDMSALLQQGAPQGQPQAQAPEQNRSQQLLNLIEMMRNKRIENPMAIAPGSYSL